VRLRGGGRARFPDPKVPRTMHVAPHHQTLVAPSDTKVSAIPSSNRIAVPVIVSVVRISRNQSFRVRKRNRAKEVTDEDEGIIRLGGAGIAAFRSRVRPDAGRPVLHVGAAKPADANGAGRRPKLA